jgi:hypothetical protein
MKRAVYMRAFLALALAAGAGPLVGMGCSSPDGAATVDPTAGDAAASRAQFAFVAPVLSRRCGSIDCHGSIYRNMRVFGYGGLRLGPAGKITPMTPMLDNPEEVEATYEAVVGLEPEVMRTVVEQGGAGVERLTFVRKGRGDEDHKGNKRLNADSDLCVTSWLANHVDEDACRRGGCFVTKVDDAGVVTNQITGTCP